MRAATEGDDAFFVGSVDRLEFRLRRTIRYQNSFQPVVDGRVATGLGGARVDATLHLPTGIAVFLAVWLAFLAAIFAFFVRAGASDPHRLAFAVVPLGLAAFGATLCIGGFRLEAGRVRALLTAVVTGEPVPEVGRWPERILEFSWDDVRAAGVLGWAWVGVFAVSAALFVYNWELRQAGCTNAQKADPTFDCPSDARVFVVWGFAALAISSFMIGIWPVRRRRPRLLIPVLAVQICALVALAWIATDPAFHVQKR